MISSLIDSQFVPSYQARQRNNISWPTTIYCDFDGPIVDVSDRYYQTYESALTYTQALYQTQGQKLLLQKLEKKQFWQMKQDRVPDVEIARSSGFQEEQIEVFLDYVRKIVNNPELLQLDKMQSGVNWALALLHSQGIELVLVTLRCEEQVKEILNNYGLKRLFSGIYGTQNCHIAYQNNAQAKTELLREAIANHGQRSTCMIGDTEADIIAAQNTGIPAIALSCGIRSVLYLQKFKPDCIYSDLLSLAHNLVTSVKQF